MGPDKMTLNTGSADLTMWAKLTATCNNNTAQHSVVRAPHNTAEHSAAKLGFRYCTACYIT